MAKKQQETQELETFNGLFDRFKRLHGRMKPETGMGAVNIAAGKLAADRGELFTVRKSFKFAGEVLEVGDEYSADKFANRLSFLCERGFICPTKAYAENETYRRFEKAQKSELIPLSQRLNTLHGDYTQAVAFRQAAELALRTTQAREKLAREALERGEAEGVATMKALLSDLDASAPDLAHA